MSWYMQHITAKQNARTLAPQTAIAANNGIGAAFLFASAPVGTTPSGTTSG